MVVVVTLTAVMIYRRKFSTKRPVAIANHPEALTGVHVDLNQAMPHAMAARTDSRSTNQDAQQAITVASETECTEMDTNQAMPYVTANTAPTDSNVASVTAGCMEVEANQTYSVPTDSNVVYSTVDCIEVEANQAYGTNAVLTDPNVAYGTVDCVEMEANQAYGTNAVPTDANVADNRSTVPNSAATNDYDYVAL